jgi:CheY-like chemotaxis protein
LNDAADLERPFHLVLTDAAMPGVDGFTLADQIRRDGRLKATKIILLTSTGLVEQPGGMGAGAFAATLTKPVKQSDLLDAIVTAFATPAVSPRPQEQRVRARQPAVRSLRVLVAEDNRTNQKLLVTLLEQHGHQVLTVGNGRQAVKSVGEQAFDLILMDVQMPEMGGLEATRVIREQERKSSGHTPIIALTARAMPGDREQCLAAGMDAYVSKPLRPDELFSTIDSLLATVSTTSVVDVSTLPSGESTALLDAATLLAGFGGNASLLGEVAGVFLADTPALVASMWAAARAGDGAELAAAAHSMKGAVGLFSQGEAFESARRLEQIARDGELSEVDAACTEVDSAVSQLMVNVRELRKALMARGE